MTNWILFAAITVFAVSVSIHAWRTRLAYGYFRFFGFEAIGVLVVRNFDHWFHDPWSAHQVASWILLFGSALVAAHSIYLLRSIGKARRRLIEETRELVETGIYRLIRHPAYLSLILLAWGSFLKGADVINAALALGATVLFIGTARFEERFNLERFGTSYAGYMKRTKRFIPFVW